MAKYRGLGRVINRAVQLLDYGTLIIESMRNVASGFAGLNEDAELVGPIIATADTAAHLATYAPAAGELVYETDTDRFMVGVGGVTCPNLKSILRSVLLENLNLNGYSLTSGTNQHIYITPGSGAGIGIGPGALARLPGMLAQSCGSLAFPGDTQREQYLLSGSTVDANPTELTYPSRYVLQQPYQYDCTLRINAFYAGGTKSAKYCRSCLVKYIGGTVSLVGGVQTIGTDIETEAGWDVAITADDVNKSLKVTVTGEASVRWVVAIDALVSQGGGDD